MPSKLPFPPRRRRLMMIGAVAVFVTLLSSYVQLLHAAVARGERLQLQRCAQAKAVASPACAR
jgi:hypothetical protein